MIIGYVVARVIFGPLDKIQMQVLRKMNPVHSKWLSTDFRPAFASLLNNIPVTKAVI